MNVVFTIFLKLVKMSVKASIVGLIILVLLKVFKNKIPAKYRILFWVPFIFLLIVPISIESNYSIYSYIEAKMNNLTNNVFNIQTDSLTYREKNKIEVSNDGAVEKLEEKELSKTSEQISTNNFQTSNIIEMLVILWIIVLLIGLAAFVVVFFKFSKKEKNNFVEPKFQLIFEKCKKRLKIKSSFICLLYNSDIKVPGITGVFNVRVMFNDTFYLLNDDQIKCIFLHELTHFKRKDNVLNFICEVLKIVYIFNPLIWLFMNRLKEDIEYATDNKVSKILTKKEKEIYCKALLIYNVDVDKDELIQSNQIKGYSSILEQRIEVIYKKKKYKKIFLFFLILLLLLTTICFGTSPKELERNDIENILNKKFTNGNLYIKEEYFFTNSYNFILKKYFCKNYMFVKNSLNNKQNIIDFRNVKNYLINTKNIKIQDMPDDANIFSKYTTLINDSNYSYSYLGKIEYNRKECAYISLYRKSKTTFKCYDLIIELSTGLVQKDEYYLNTSDNSKPEKPERTITYDYQFNVVTQKDFDDFLNLDLSEYTIHNETSDTDVDIDLLKNNIRQEVND